MILGLVLGVLLFMLDSYLSVFIWLAIYSGLLCSISLIKFSRLGLTVGLVWSVLTDLLYYPFFPVTTCALLSSYWIWHNFINPRFNSSSIIYIWLSGSLWLLMFMMLRIIFVLLNGLITNNLVSLRPDYWSFAGYSLLLNVLILGGLITLGKWLGYLKNIKYASK